MGGPGKVRTRESGGFVAYYKDKRIASAVTLQKLANKAKVKALLGNKDLVIKHSVPEDVVVVYYFTVS